MGDGLNKWIIQFQPLHIYIYLKIICNNKLFFKKKY